MNEVRTTRPFFDIALGGTAPKFREIVCPSRRENPKPGGERLPPSRPRLYFRVPHGEAPAEPSPSCLPHLRDFVSSCAIHPGPRHLARVCPWISACQLVSLSAFIRSPLSQGHQPLRVCSPYPTFSNRTVSDLNSKTVRFEFRRNHQPTNWMPNNAISNRSSKKVFMVRFGPI